MWLTKNLGILELLIVSPGHPQPGSPEPEISCSSFCSRTTPGFEVLSLLKVGVPEVSCCPRPRMQGDPSPHLSCFPMVSIDILLFPQPNTALLSGNTQLLQCFLSASLRKSWRLRFGWLQLCQLAELSWKGRTRHCPASRGMDFRAVLKGK